MPSLIAPPNHQTNIANSMRGALEAARTLQPSASSESNEMEAIKRAIFGPQLLELQQKVNLVCEQLTREVESVRESVTRRFTEFETRIKTELSTSQQQSRDSVMRALHSAMPAAPEVTATPAALNVMEEKLRIEISMSAAQVANQFRVLLDERMEEHFSTSSGREQLLKALELAFKRNLPNNSNT